MSALIDFYPEFSTLLSNLSFKRFTLDASTVNGKFSDYVAFFHSLFLPGTGGQFWWLFLMYRDQIGRCGFGFIGLSCIFGCTDHDSEGVHELIKLFCIRNWHW